MGFAITPCPKCGEPPRVVIGAFLVAVDAFTGEKLAVYKPIDDQPHVFECGGGHQWAAERSEDSD